MPAHAPITLAQAIERVVNIENAGAPFAGLSDAITDLARARARLDGLEEARATLDLREKAYTRADELVTRQPPGFLDNVNRPGRVLAIAHFLAPAWDDLEDPLGPTEGLADAEAAQAGAEAQADELRDRVDTAEAIAETRRLLLGEANAYVLKAQGLLHDAKVQVEARDHRIEELERELAERNSVIDALTLTAGGRAERIEELERELGQARAQTDTSRRTAEALERRAGIKPVTPR